MQSVAQMVAQGYRFGAPTQEVEEMDAQVVEGLECRKCGSSMHYEAYHRQGQYIALAICNRCGYEIAF